MVGISRLRLAIGAGFFVVVACLLLIAVPDKVFADPVCQTNGVYVLFARGSGAPFNSNEATAFNANVTQKLHAKGIGNVGWAELGNLDGNYQVSNGEYYAANLLTQGAAYGDSVRTGTDELVRHLNQRYGSAPGDRNCFNETVVLGGYSQGADVIGWAIERSGGLALSAAARDHIGFVALYGDPKLDAGTLEGRQAGQAPWWVRGNNSGVGVDHTRSGAVVYYLREGILGERVPYAPVNFYGRFGSWCDTGDGVCGAYNLINFGSHTTAYAAGPNWILNSAEEIANGAINRLGLFVPAQGGVGSATYLGSDTLGTNQAMLKNQYIMSPDGMFVLMLQLDGNLVLYGPGYQAIWSANTGGPNVSHLVMQGDGNLVLYSTTGQPLWYNSRSGAGSRLVVQLDGNVVQYINTGQAVWWTGTGRAVAPITYKGTDHLNVNQSLGQNQFLRSTNGTRFLLLQSDGNLVLYGPGYHVLWYTGTGGSAASHVDMQSDGNVVLYKPSGLAVWSNQQNGTTGSHLDMQPDGNLVEYNTAGQAIWWSGTGGRL